MNLFIDIGCGPVISRFSEGDESWGLGRPIRGRQLRSAAITSGYEPTLTYFGEKPSICFLNYVGLEMALLIICEEDNLMHA